MASILSGAIVLSGCGAQQDAPASADPVLLVDRLLEAFNAEDAEEVAAIFGDDVAFTLDSGEDLVGADAVAHWESYFGRETGERVTDGFQPSDGHTFFMTEFTQVASGWTSTQVYDVEMEGERLVRMGSRSRRAEEVIATGEVDELHAALNDRDADRLAEQFEAITYTPPAGEQSSGPEAAERWADGFGFTVTRTSDVFEIGEGLFAFVSEHTERDSGRSTTHVVEIEVDVSGGAEITGMTERRQGN